MTDRLAAAVAAHHALVEAIRAMYPDETPEALADTIAGESDLDAMVIATLREAVWLECQAEAAQQRVEQIRGRKASFEFKAERLRAAALQAMTDAGMPKVWSADLSASVSKGPVKVLIFDEKLIPLHYMREVAPAPDKRAIAEQLKHGGHVPGCGLSNAADVLRVRRD